MLHLQRSSSYNFFPCIKCMKKNIYWIVLDIGQSIEKYGENVHLKVLFLIKYTKYEKV